MLVRSPFSPIYFLFFLGLLLWIIFSIKLGLITLTFQKLGLNPESALTLLIRPCSAALSICHCLRCARPHRRRRSKESVTACCVVHHCLLPAALKSR
jgi:hypothetical protein